MQIGMIGFGRMGANMVHRLSNNGHTCVAYARHAETVNKVLRPGVTGASSLEDLVAKLEQPRVVWLFRLHGNGTVAATCQISLPGAADAGAGLTAAPGVASLLRVMHGVGYGGGYCGSDDANAAHDAQALAAEARAALRPWATGSVRGATDPAVYYQFDQRTRDFLAEWGRGDAWSQREYQTMLAQIPAAQDGAASYLQQRFGMTPGAAATAGATVVQQLLGARFILPYRYQPDAAGNQLYFRRSVFADAIASHDQRALDLAFMRANSMNQRSSLAPAIDFQQVLSAQLANTVEWPQGLRWLLAQGASPTVANSYGKTALMMAAHMDRPDAVRALLAAGADVGARTVAVAPGRCVEGPARGGRTALTYAAENASPAVMKLLLDAGADPAVRDSKGSGLDFYLDNNPRLTADEKALGIVKLAAQAARFAGPSFSCKGATSATEKAICGSDVLSSFDAELARAYGQFRLAVGAAAVADQRGWLKQRELACHAADPLADCLAENTRTRIRYLQNRVTESGTGR